MNDIKDMSRDEIFAAINECFGALGCSLRALEVGGSVLIHDIVAPYGGGDVTKVPGFVAAHMNCMSPDSVFDR